VTRFAAPVPVAPRIFFEPQGPKAPGCPTHPVECNETYEDHEDSDQFDLTIIIAGRNDDYGGTNGTGGSLSRFQISLRWMDFHLQRLGNLSVEMIVVDWNPPPDKLPLSAVLRKPAGLASMRFITVDGSVHASLATMFGGGN
jgi:hypothetical protein